MDGNDIPRLRGPRSGGDRAERAGGGAVVGVVAANGNMDIRGSRRSGLVKFGCYHCLLCMEKKSKSADTRCSAQ
jgi:hypothetical protein